MVEAIGVPVKPNCGHDDWMIAARCAMLLPGSKAEGGEEAW